MQFKIPQDVQREDQIVWFLTIKQLIICTIGGIIAYGVYTSLSKIYILSVALVPTIIIALITVAFAFVKIKEIAFPKFLLLIVEHYLLVPQKRIWQKGTGDVYRSILHTEAVNEKETELENKKMEELSRKKKLQELIANLENNKK